MVGILGSFYKVIHITKNVLIQTIIKPSDQAAEIEYQNIFQIYRPLWEQRERERVDVNYRWCEKGGSLNCQQLNDKTWSSDTEILISKRMPLLPPPLLPLLPDPSAF